MRRNGHQSLEPTGNKVVERERAALRDGNDREQIRRIMSTQASRNERLAKADDVIENTVDFDQLDELIRAQHQRYLALAQRADSGNA